MRIAAISDMHGYLPPTAYFAGADVVVIAGDVCPVFDSHKPEVQYAWLESVYSDWLQEVQRQCSGAKNGAYVPIIQIPGNHDFVFQGDIPVLPAMTLIDSYVNIEGIGFYGTPWSHSFGPWAFMADEDVLAEKWAKIPAHQTDVLIVHGPPYRTLDKVGLADVGSKTLRAYIEKSSIPVVVTGHIHEGYGHTRLKRDDGLYTDVYNVAHCDEYYTKMRTEVVKFDVVRK